MNINIEAPNAQALLSPETRELEHKWRSWTRSAISAAKKRQVALGERGVAITITSDELMAKLRAANYRCASSGVEFRRDPFGSFGPTLPSIDRIDPDGPYSDNNTRVVCLRCRGSMAS
jgi:hypothetical protein